MSDFQANAIAYIAFAISVGSAIIGIINHKQIRSSCCGAKGTIGIDIGPTSPLRSPLIRPNSIIEQLP